MNIAKKAIASLFIVAMSLSAVSAQTQTGGEANAKDAKSSKQKGNDKTPTFTGEQLAEGVIIAYGQRAVLNHIRRNGIERGKITRYKANGGTDNVDYEYTFVRGENSEKDKIRFDQKLPSLEYSLIFNEGKVFGVLKDVAFTPRQDAIEDFMSLAQHGLDALLRYKENGATVNYIGKETQQNVDLYVLDVVNKDQSKTRFFISARLLKVSRLEYEMPDRAGNPQKFTRRFYDYKNVQGTLLPFRTVLYQNADVSEESQIMTAVYGGKIDDALFSNPAPAGEGD